MQLPWRGVSIYALSHFLVDFACAYCLFSQVVAAGDWQLQLLLYNFCAFALQMPLGLLADRLNRNGWLAAAGCLLVALALLCLDWPLVAVLLAGCGNALFHLGGGLSVLNISQRKSAALGVFVSPGALGIFLGALLGKQALLPGWLLPLLLLLAAFAACWIQKQGGALFPANAPLTFAGLTRPRLLAVLSLLLVVCLRSYVGLALSFSWRQDGWVIALLAALVLGKVAGGILADRCGLLRTALATLALAALGFAFSAWPPAGLLAVFCFNMSMPLTLFALANYLPGAKGFAFGLLTFGLFLGFLPVFFAAPALSGGVAAWLAVVSCLLLGWGLRGLPR